VPSLAKLGQRLADDDDTQAELATAANCHESARLSGVLEKESATNPTTNEQVRVFWMDVVVAWLYTNRDVLRDPWATLEEVWEAFDHPPQLNRLIRWMPVPVGEPTGEAAMLDRWRAYVEDHMRGSMR
jgi:hypothetical protein